MSSTSMSSVGALDRQLGLGHTTPQYCLVQPPVPSPPSSSSSSLCAASASGSYGGGVAVVGGRGLDRDVGGWAGAEVSLNAMSLLFSEVVQYNKGRSKTGEAFHQRMADVGYGIGKRMLELASFNRDKKLTRELTHEDILKWISYTVWKRLFGKNSECNLKIYDSDEYAIVDDNLLVTRYISGADNLRCEYFVAGIVQGMLDGANFGATVTVPDLVIDGKNKPGFLIHLHKDVVERTERLTRG